MIKIFKFRANDLNPSAGKQIEFNTAVSKDFFHFVNDRETIVCHYIDANGEEKNVIESGLSLSPARGDYKIYQNSNGKPNLKDFFLETLHLTLEKNGDDYFALRQREGNHYDLFYFPHSINITNLYSSLLLNRNGFQLNDILIDLDKIDDNNKPYTIALRSKPFMILAGISGTGKSRIVREFAYMTCPKELQDEDGTTPGNYCMIEVKPNWHDSSELLGYYSAMNQQYIFTKFVWFVVKAWLHPNTPFFVCLDEMNLAPVEQYFAEFLSVLETRSRDKEGNIASGTLIESQYFDDSSTMVSVLGLDKVVGEWGIKVREHLVNNGLTLPPNLMIIGTVNMDDTTYQFSRKVIDRAMTIEMNGGELKNMFGNSKKLQYRTNPIGLSAFKARYLNADEVLEVHADFANRIKEILPQKIEVLNKMLEYTPFQVSYRVLNELVVYAGVLLDDAKANGGEIDFEQIAVKAFDQITLMKILPRIEGDEDMFIRGGQNVLEHLQSLFAPESASHKKLTEMKERLDRTGFTRFWP